MHTHAIYSRTLLAELFLQQGSSSVSDVNIQRRHLHELSIWAAVILHENLVNRVSLVQGLSWPTVSVRMDSSLSSTEYDGNLAYMWMPVFSSLEYVSSCSWFITLHMSHKYTFLKISEPHVLSKVTMGNNLLLILLTYLKTATIFTFSSLFFPDLNNLSLFSISSFAMFSKVLVVLIALFWTL